MSNNKKEHGDAAASIPDLSSGIEEMVRKEGASREVFFKGITSWGLALVVTRPKGETDPDAAIESNRAYQFSFDRSGMVIAKILPIIHATGDATHLDRIYSLDPDTYNCPDIMVGHNVILRAPSQDQLGLRRFRNNLSAFFPTTRVQTLDRVDVFQGNLEKDIDRAFGTLSISQHHLVFGHGGEKISTFPLFQIPTKAV